MIVKCTQCQTRFKIPDEKVTDRGVKVRCTKCQNTFRVTRADAAGGEAPPPAVPAPPSTPDPFAQFGPPPTIASSEQTRPGVFIEGLVATKFPGPAAVRPPASISAPPASGLGPLPAGPALPSAPPRYVFDPAPAAPTPNRPFAAPPAAPARSAPPVDPFDFLPAGSPSSSGSSAGADPFDFMASSGPPEQKPTAASRASAALAADPFDFSAPSGPTADPFGAVDFVAPAGSGADPFGTVDFVPPPSPAADPFATVDDPFGLDAPSTAGGRADAGPAASADPFGLELGDPVAAGRNDASSFADPGSDLAPDTGLELEAPAARAGAGRAQAGAPGAGAPAGARDLFGAPGALDLYLDGGAEPAPAELRGTAPPRVQNRVEILPELQQTDPSPVATPRARQVAASAPIPRPTGSPEQVGMLEPLPAPTPVRRFIGLVMNLGVAGLLLLMIGVVVQVWANDGRFEPAAFSVDAVRGLFSAPRALTATDVSNGLYDTKAGRLLFYVRGEVRNHGTASAQVRVQVELLDGLERVRAAQTVAGAAASPEELYSVGSASEFDGLLAALGARTASVSPGGKASFVVPFYDYPPDLAALKVRVSLLEAAPTATARE